MAAPSASANSTTCSAPSDGDQLARRAERDQLALVHDADAIAQRVRFVHVMRGDQNRAAALRETARALPTAAGATADRARSSARRETAAPARPASAHATDSRCFCPPDSFDTHASRFGASSTMSSSSSTGGAARIERSEQPQRFFDGQLVGQLRFLQLDAEPRPQRGGVALPSAGRAPPRRRRRRAAGLRGFRWWWFCRRRSARAGQNIRRAAP